MTVYYKMRQMLLQNVTAILLQNATEVYYKMRQDFYWKMRQFYYKMRQLLQNATFIRSCDSTWSLFYRYNKQVFHASTQLAEVG